MKRQDIKIGVDYAYREGGYGSYKRVRFLTLADKDMLYTTNRWKQDIGFIRDRHAGGPGKGNSYKQRIGWIAAEGDNLHKASLEEVMLYGHQVDELGNEPSWENKDYRYFLVTSMSYIHGEYDILVKAQEDAAEMLRRKASERNAHGRVQQAAWIPVRDKFRELFSGSVNLTSGIGPWTESAWNEDGASFPDHVSLDREAAEDVLSFISALDDKIFSLEQDIVVLDELLIEKENRIHYLEP